MISLLYCLTPILLLAAIIGGILLCRTLLHLYLKQSETAKSGWQLRLICRDLFFVALLGATLFAFGRALFFPYRSPQDIFQEAVGVPPPASMHLLESESQDSTIWLHFQLSPTDLKALLKSQKYLAERDELRSVFFSSVDYSPYWWKIDDMRIYSLQFNPNGNPYTEKIWFRYMLVNSENNDIYFEYQLLDR